MNALYATIRDFKEDLCIYHKTGEGEFKLLDLGSNHVFKAESPDQLDNEEFNTFIWKEDGKKYLVSSIDLEFFDSKSEAKKYIKAKGKL
jgi:hypothetical protein